MDLRSLSEASQFKTVLKSQSLQLSGARYCSAVCFLVDNTKNCNLISVISAVCFGRQNKNYTNKKEIISVSAPKHSKHRK